MSSMGSSSDDPSGLRVQITIEEDGTQNPPSLPAGTISRKMAGTDGFQYYVVRLDDTVRCIRALTREEWTLEELVLTEHFSGASLSSLRSRFRRPFVHVRIMNPLVPLRVDDPVLDLTRVAYFALGTVRKA